jgi:hypothetical protein
MDDLLEEAGRELRKLERRAAKCNDDAELMRLNRQIGAGVMVFALEFQDPKEAAIDVSDRLIAWADRSAGERLR